MSEQEERYFIFTKGQYTAIYGEVLRFLRSAHPFLATESVVSDKSGQAMQYIRSKVSPEKRRAEEGVFLNKEEEGFLQDFLASEMC